ncbi:hypothetical protein H6P81_014704 [Aristolochia fimbriata]|uniref:Uncharacterized protein n=1 Tax=Aristolochia fimbriata TaxID=158543 RepID=A0AAV7E587_ARIFI|nr:hypothetical protein H6P81_014704 [Aristolochia fimbriata]
MHSSPDFRVQDMDVEIRMEKLESAIPCSTFMEVSGVTEVEDGKHCSVFDCNNIGPRTPPDRGNEIAAVGSDSPLTSTSASLTPSREKVSDSGSTPDICTPVSHIFNPFAPGPEELALAPRKRPLGESRSLVARKLNFESNAKSLEGLIDEEAEESFLEAMYESIMDVVASVQVDEVLSKNLPLESDLIGQVEAPKQVHRLASGGAETLQFETPKHLPRLTGVAETCPGAPMKPVGRSKALTDRSLCRKLEF